MTRPDADEMARREQLAREAIGDDPTLGGFLGERREREIAARDRLEYLRDQIDAEQISYSEIAELQSLAEYIDPSDVVLREWAGIPEDRPFPFRVERWSFGRWLFIGERKTRDSAERLIEHYRAYPAYANSEYRIEEAEDTDPEVLTTPMRGPRGLGAFGDRCECGQELGHR